MRNMNTAQARVVDPILSTHARGYTNAEMIGHRGPRLTRSQPRTIVPRRGPNS